MARSSQTDRTPDRGPLTLIAWGATIVWLLIAAVVYFGMTGGEAGLDPLRVMMVPVAVFGPVALVWIAALNAMRLAEIRRALRALGGEGDISRKLDEVLKAQRDIEAALARSGGAVLSAPTETSATAVADPAPAPRPEAGAPLEPSRPARSRDVERTPETPAAPADPSLDLRDAEGGRVPVETATLIHALQFPADPDDSEGFRAMRRALRDRGGKQIVTAAQDVLTLLSQDGIYMDDFVPVDVAPDIWRRFARGERGRDVAAVGAVRDPAVEARIAERLRGDAVFRDATHHFVRMFDRLLVSMEPAISDEDLAALGRTRTARGFMLIGRVLGTFD